MGAPQTFQAAIFGPAGNTDTVVNHGAIITQGTSLSARAGITGAARLGALRGYVDFAGPAICAGWAQDIAAPDTPVCLDIFSAGQRISHVLANLYREDLRRAGIGDGQHGFEVTLPPGTAMPLEIRRARDGSALALTDEARARAA